MGKKLADDDDDDNNESEPERRRFLGYITAYSNYYVTRFDVNVLYVCVCVCICTPMCNKWREGRESARGAKGQSEKNNSNKTLPLSNLTRCVFRSSFNYYQ